ncbi:MAG: hypothetical protein ACTTK5_03295 [Candidatus Fimenecus sp.]
MKHEIDIKKELKIELGQIIKSNREAKGDSQRGLAKAIDLPNSNLKYIEDGINVPSFEIYKKIMIELNPNSRGVNAVQTLSRLNRIYPGYDKKTFVIDFKNEYDEIQKVFEPYYTETILGETITPSAIREVEKQLSQYNFLDYDDIELFNRFLYKDKRNSKDKSKMWSLLGKSLGIIDKNDDLIKLEIRSTIRRFLRFYGFLIQATRYQDIDLHKKYNFLSYLIKEIEIGKIGNDFDIADKITVENFKQKKTGEHDSSIESKPEIKAPAPNEVYFEEQVREKLSKIIDEINLRYNKNFDFDVATKSALQVRDLLLKNKRLKDSANSNTISDFRFAYYDAVQDALMEGYEQNMDLFSVLLKDDKMNKNLMGVFLEDVYNNLSERV